VFTVQRTDKHYKFYQARSFNLYPNYMTNWTTDTHGTYFIFKSDVRITYMYVIFSYVLWWKYAVILWSF